MLVISLPDSRMEKPDPKFNSVIETVSLPRAEWGWNYHLSNVSHIIGVHNEQFYNRVGSTWLHKKRARDIIKIIS